MRDRYCPRKHPCSKNAPKIRKRKERRRSPTASLGMASHVFQPSVHRCASRRPLTGLPIALNSTKLANSHCTTLYSGSWYALILPSNGFGLPCLLLYPIELIPLKRALTFKTDLNYTNSFIKYTRILIFTFEFSNQSQILVYLNVQQNFNKRTNTETNTHESREH